MEDILASIKSIIAGEPDPNKKAQEQSMDKAKPADKAPEKAKEDVLELTNKVDPAPMDVLSNIDAAMSKDAPASAAAPAPEPAKAAPTPAFTPAPPVAAPAPIDNAAADENQRLLSEQSSRAAAASLRNLVDNLPKPKVDSMTLRSGNTVEDLVIECLKPMLSAWVDKNLPVLVERIVEKEIKKLLPDK